MIDQVRPAALADWIREHNAPAVVLDVLYVLPTGSPLSQDAADPGCDLPETRVNSGWSTR